MAKALQDDGLASAHQPAPEAQVEPASDREPWGLFEVFILIQFLSPALLMFPGMQVLRMPIRVLPYAFSIFVFMVLFQRRGSSPDPRAQAPGSGWMVLVLALLCVNLFHPRRSSSQAWLNWHSSLPFSHLFSGRCSSR